MSKIDHHPILGQLSEGDRQNPSVETLQEALAERRRVMERDGKLTTVVSGIVGISALFFMKPLPFYLILALLIIGLPLVWRHLVKEARDFVMTDAEIEEIISKK